MNEVADRRTTLPMLRTSERRTFKRCPQRWWWSWREGLTTNAPPSLPLWFGTGWHQVMAHWYCGPGLKRGAHPLKVWREWVGDEIIKIRVNIAGEDWQEEQYVDAAELGEAMIGNYLDVYGKDEAWHVIQPERSSRVIIKHPVSGLPLVLYCFTYDLVYRDLRDDTIWLGEHKTAKAIQTGHLALDDQGGSYWAVATDELRHDGLIGQKETLKGIMYNFVRKSPGDDRPVNADGLATNKPTKTDYLAALHLAGVPWDRKWNATVLAEVARENEIPVFGPVSKNQPAANFLREPVFRTVRERNSQIQRIQNEAVAMAQYRVGALKLIKNPTGDCKWDCSFYQMCILHERGSDWEEYRDALYVRRDPYADHRKSTHGDES